MLIEAQHRDGVVIGRIVDEDGDRKTVEVIDRSKELPDLGPTVEIDSETEWRPLPEIEADKYKGDLQHRRFIEKLDQLTQPTTKFRTDHRIDFSTRRLIDTLHDQVRLDRRLKTSGSVPSIDSEVATLIRARLERFETVAPVRVGRLSVRQTNLIVDAEIETAEGEAMVVELKHRLMLSVGKYSGFNPFHRFNLFLDAGFLHLFDRERPSSSVIPRSERFDYLKDLSGSRFDYSMIVEADREPEARRDVERVLSQQRVIALQFAPQYADWGLRRLLMLWVADPIGSTILRVKILINSLLATGRRENSEILPMVVVYPTYGAETARQLLATISKYFSYYTPLAGPLPPDGFVELNRLIYSTDSLTLRAHGEGVRDREQFLQLAQPYR